MVSTGVPARVRLFENDDEHDHATEICDRLARADRFICITAFGKSSGFELIRTRLESRIRDGMDAVIIAGTHFFQTEPRLLSDLLALAPLAERSGASLEIYMGASERGPTFHPKLYHFGRRGHEDLVVGSANLTAGGLQNNWEMSAALTAKGRAWEDQIRDMIAGWVTDEAIIVAGSEAVAAYAARHKIYSATMRAAERMARRAAEKPVGGVVALEVLLLDMKSAEGEAHFDRQMARRAKSRRHAGGLIKALAADPDLTPARFEARFGELAGAWHSSGIARGQGSVAKKGALFQQALRALAASKSRDPAELFDLLLAYFDRISRAGINTLTEILHTHDPGRFAVMNSNSLSGMRLAGFDYPKRATKGTIDGARYARFCADADRLRAQLGLADLSELDALFNFAYWKPAGDDDDA